MNKLLNDSEEYKLTLKGMLFLELQDLAKCENICHSICVYMNRNNYTHIDMIDGTGSFIDINENNVNRNISSNNMKPWYIPNNWCCTTTNMVHINE